MNKQEMIAEIAKANGQSKADAERSLNAVIQVITDTIKKGESISLPGFGQFSVVAKEARTGRNPLTGEAIAIPARKSPKFTPGKSLKDAANQ